MRYLIAIVAAFLTLNLSAQNGWNWGADKAECEQNYVLLKTSTGAKRYQEAHPALVYLLKEAPNLNKALYQYAPKVYEGLASKEKDKARKHELQDSALIMYDTRIKLYGEEGKVLNYKGRVAYSYLINRADRRAELYPLYKKIYELNGEKTAYYNLYYYFQVAGREKKSGNMTEEELLALYDELGKVMDNQVAAQTSESKKKAIVKYKGKIDEKLTDYVEVNCEFIKKVFGEKFKTNPDVAIAKKTLVLLKNAECLSDPLFLEVANYVLENDPNYTDYRILAKVYRRDKNYEKAIENFEKALELAENDDDKAKTIMDIAELYSSSGQKGKAREYAYKKLELKPDDTSVYTFIGNLYLYGSKSCTSGSDPLKNTLAYIAAYEKYQKAGNSAKMAEARKYFPTVEMMFSRSKKEGDSMNTGCWIGETVTLRKR